MRQQQQQEQEQAVPDKLQTPSGTSTWERWTQQIRVGEWVWHQRMPGLEMSHPQPAAAAAMGKDTAAAVA
jgi:hypothetical protein